MQRGNAEESSFHRTHQNGRALVFRTRGKLKLVRESARILSGWQTCILQAKEVVRMQSMDARQESSAKPLPADDLLAASLRQHDHAAFAELHQRYARLVRTVAMRIVRSRTEADDVVQIVFQDLYRAAAQYDAHKGSLRTWVLQYAYSRAINYKRHLDARAYARTYELEDVDLPTCSGMPAMEAAQMVAQAMGSLSDAQQQTLRMVFLEGAELQDVALQTGQSLANVRHHYYRGLHKLRECLRNSPASPKA